MPKATHTHTPNPIVVALQIAADNLSSLPAAAGGRLTYQDAILREACDAARVTHAAMTALSLSVADLAPADPRREAADVAVAHLWARWADEVQQAWTIPAAGVSGLRDKARLLDGLIDRDDDGVVPGGPALALAASLTADVLLLCGAST
jgi:hypothetical protein